MKTIDNIIKSHGEATGVLYESMVALLCEQENVSHVLNQISKLHDSCISTELHLEAVKYASHMIRENNRFAESVNFYRQMKGNKAIIKILSGYYRYFHESRLYKVLDCLDVGYAATVHRRNNHHNTITNVAIHGPSGGLIANTDTLGDMGYWLECQLGEVDWSKV